MNQVEKLHAHLGMRGCNQLGRRRFGVCEWLERAVSGAPYLRPPASFRNCPVELFWDLKYMRTWQDLLWVVRSLRGMDPQKWSVWLSIVLPLHIKKTCEALCKTCSCLLGKHVCSSSLAVLVPNASWITLVWQGGQRSYSPIHVLCTGLPYIHPADLIFLILSCDS